MWHEAHWKTAKIKRSCRCWISQSVGCLFVCLFAVVVVLPTAEQEVHLAKLPLSSPLILRHKLTNLQITLQITYKHTLMRHLKTHTGEKSNKLYSPLTGTQAHKPTDCTTSETPRFREEIHVDDIANIGKGVFTHYSVHILGVNLQHLYKLIHYKFCHVHNFLQCGGGRIGLYQANNCFSQKRLFLSSRRDK